MKILKDYWLVFAVALVLIGLGIWVCTRPQPAPLPSPAAEKAVKAAITKNQEHVGRDTTRAKQAAATAPANYEAGRAYATVAATIHQQANAHAKPTATSDTAAARLQRALTNY